MFSRIQRIRKSEEIITLLRQGKRINEGPLSFFFQEKSGSMARVTVIVSTKVSKNAVTRNLLKRRIRAILRQLGLPQGDLVVRTNPGSEKLSGPELQEKIKKVLSSLKPHA